MDPALGFPNAAELCLQDMFWVYAPIAKFNPIKARRLMINSRSLAKQANHQHV